MRIGLLTDFPAVEFTNGPGLASQAFRRNMEARGHNVRLIGPRPLNGQREVSGDATLFNAFAMKRYANTPFGFPWPLNKVKEDPQVDVIHGNSNGFMMHYALMMRKRYGIPCLQTNTTHFPAFKHHMMPKKVLEAPVTGPLLEGLSNYVEKSFTDIYSAGDGLIVQCQGLVDYWRDKGLDVPVHIIPRPVDVRSFDRPVVTDPFSEQCEKGFRLLVVCRHAPEKSLDRLLRIFARYILPQEARATLTLVGDGPAHKGLVELAGELGVRGSVHFAGERPHRDLPMWYSNADLFVYPSVSETFGQVISEALWKGVPTIGFDDKMGMAYQVTDGENGRLLADGPGGDEAFGGAVLNLLGDPTTRLAMGQSAARRQRALCHPDSVYRAYERAYDEAAQHVVAKPPKTFGSPGLRQDMHLAVNHAWPWTWKMFTFLAASRIPVNPRYNAEYTPSRAVPFDAAPEALPNLSPTPTTSWGHLRVIAGEAASSASTPLARKKRRAR
jgi:1,2-diacylglycerol 3-alpha-glucosyltransferase